ncbi:MAG: FkbM family methyltransferase, partial [Nanoarchaeota archaeon]
MKQIIDSSLPKINIFSQNGAINIRIDFYEKFSLFFKTQYLENISGQIEDILFCYKLFSKFIKEDSWCLDIGANYGRMAIIMSKLIGKNGKVICIEPSKIALKILEENLFQNNYSDYKIYNIAFGDICSEVNFVFSPTHDNGYMYNNSEDMKKS